MELMVGGKDFGLKFLYKVIQCQQFLLFQELLLFGKTIRPFLYAVVTPALQLADPFPLKRPEHPLDGFALGMVRQSMMDFHRQGAKESKTGKPFVQVHCII